MNREPTRLAIMQPYLFPYPGYFSLIKSTNEWIVFDTPQYVRHSWMNRNRIIKPNSNEWMYFIVPVKKHKSTTIIQHIEIQNDAPWKDKIVAQLGHYRKFAPHYKDVVDLLVETLKPEFENLVELNVHTLAAVCGFLGIPFNFKLLSKMELKMDPVSNPDEWALNICKALGISKYINAEGGKSFFQKELFYQSNIDLQFFKYGYPVYDQKIDIFIPGLSIIDMMMFNTPEETNQMLDAYKLVE